MVKDRFVSAYAEPEYTVAVGGSGGAIQQYVYGQNHPGLIDAGVPQYSYPDMVTQTIHVGDCELLERWLDSKVLADPLSIWRTWVNRTLIEGLNASARDPEPVRAGDAVHADARLERVHQRLARPFTARAQPELRHGARLRPGRLRAGGVDALGRPGEHLRHRRDGLRALAVGQRRASSTGSRLSRAVRSRRREFLDLNANVGSWKRSADMVQEGCPYIAALCATQSPDVWSARNMQPLADGGATPAPRREGDQKAQYAAYR